MEGPEDASEQGWFGLVREGFWLFDRGDQCDYSANKLKADFSRSGVSAGLVDSVDFETKYGVGARRGQRVLPVLEHLVGFDAIEVLIQLGDGQMQNA